MTKFKGKDGNAYETTVVKRGVETTITLFAGDPLGNRRVRRARASERNQPFGRILKPDLGREIPAPKLAWWIRPAVELSYMHSTRGPKSQTIDQNDLKALFSVPQEPPDINLTIRLANDSPAP